MTAPDAAASGYWPWWLGALVLGGVAVAHLLFAGRLLGVSGIYLKLVKWRAEREAARAEEAFEAGGAALDEALEEATRQLLAQHPELAAELPPPPPAVPAFAPDASAPERPVRRVPLTAHLLFLFAAGLGGAAARLAHGSFGFDGLHPQLLQSWGTPAAALGVLFAGGALVGFGASLSGGCTSGHGLSGCSRLQPGSLVVTGCFLASAVGVALLLGGER